MIQKEEVAVLVQPENRNIFLIFALCLWFIFVFILVLQQGQQINHLQEEVAKLQNQQTNTAIEIKETEEKCQRMTDTCIDILSNKRWE